ncbi:MAG: hypothetical protein BWK80_23555 [Desulfobacteraceae bacterium IS3]|nr:MAG: hypothetical protein BWK80_23555 [Desulfobacteraceae bacterium IS3]
MVVWLFSGGGEAEVRGLMPFLRRHFPEYKFERKSPVRRKPGPRPGITSQYGYGLTGKGLVKEIPKRLRDSLNNNEKCDIILIFDDLDCRDCCRQKEDYLNAVESVEGIADIKKYAGFAAPEIEAWIIADWDNSFAKHPDFRERHRAMRYWLSVEKQIPFDKPESFGKYDPKRDTCDEKMSQAIIESTRLTPDDQYKPLYSKAKHTPELLSDIEPLEVLKRCPLFRDFYYYFKPVHDV